MAGFCNSKTMGVDSATLEANAAMKLIVRRDTGDNYMGSGCGGVIAI